MSELRYRTGAEARSALRLRTLKAARIVVNTATIHCLIRDLSASGARLEVENPLSVPEEFGLIILPEKIRVPAEVVWRIGNHIGVLLPLGLEGNRR